MNRIRVLAVAPYEQMREDIAQVAKDYPNIDTTIVVADLEHGVEAALSSLPSNYDVVISRGGTAQVLERSITVPVIPIEVSPLDALGQLQDAQSGGRRVAVVGFEGAIRSFEYLRDLADAPFELVSIAASAYVDEVMGAIAAEHFDLVLCDKSSYEAARQADVPARLLVSGPDSIHSAFERAIFHCRYWRLEREREHMLWDIIDHTPNRLVIYLRTGEVLYSNLDPQNGALYALLRSHVGDLEANRLVFRVANRVHRVRVIPLEVGSDRMVAFSINTFSAHVQRGLTGIAYLNSSEVREASQQDFLAVTGAATAFEVSLERANASHRPVMIRGEAGCGKEQLASLLYLRSDHTGEPFVSVDCSLIGKRSLSFLTESHHSPLYDKGQTIFFRNIDALARDDWHSLLAVLIESDVARRDHLVFSGNDAPDGSESEVVLAFSQRLRCFVVEVEPLRRTPDAIGSIAAKYVEVLSQAAGVRPPLIDPDALDALTVCHWDRNYHQLQRTLDRAFANRLLPERILVLDVREAIGRENVKAYSQTGSADSGIDVLKPLAQTERQIARLAVARCDGSKTEAARLLGISRTTLWRLLKDEDG